MAAAALAAQAAGGVVSAVGALDQARYQAGVAKNNAQIATYNASVASQKGQQEEIAQREKTSQIIGQERANAGASGVDANSGSASNVQQSTAMVGDIDAMTIRNNSARQVFGYQTQALSDKGQASMDLSQGWLNAMSSIVGSASSTSSKYQQFKTAGVFSS